MALSCCRLLRVLLFGYVFCAGVASTNLYNIALGKRTEQGPADYCHGPRYNKICHPSNLAVNDIFDKLVLSGDCSHTFRLKNVPIMSWWIVYFDGDHYLSTIRIFRRSDWNQTCCKNRFNNITIEGIFDKDNNSKRIYADDMTGTVFNTVMNITVPNEMRNTKFFAIKISVPNFYLTLCEVQVFQAISCGSVKQSLPVSNGVWKHIDTNCSHYLCKYVLACNTGYTTSLTSNITTVCDESGNWTQPTEKCQAVSCGSVTQSLPVSNEVWKHTDTNCSHYLCEYVLACNTGYTISNTSNITTVCDESGNWTQPTEQCEAVSCGSVTQSLPVSNGVWIHRDINCSHYLCQYILACNTGYTISNTSNITTVCDESGHWTQPTERCQAVSCGSVTQSLPVSNGVWKHTDTNCSHYLCEYVLACNTGYTISNTSNITTVCDESGNWTQPTEQCQAVSCGSVKQSLPVSNGVWKHTDNDCSHYLCEYVLACDTGFTSPNTRKITTVCDESGHWTQPTELCQEIFADILITEIIARSSSNSPVIGGAVGAGAGGAIIGVVISAVIILVRRRRFVAKNDACHEISGRSEMNEQNVYSNITAAHQTDLSLNSIDNFGYSHMDETMNSPRECHTKEDNQYNSKKSHSCKADGSQDENHEEYYNITLYEKGSATSIMLEDLAEFLVTVQARITKLQEQFNDFPTGLTKSHQNALREGNVKKNRYRRIYAYDENRVILKCHDEGGSDYINASYIHGYNRTKSYIASQGPTKETINDFWEMIYQEDTDKIVMLTKLKEANKIKCTQYWPEKESQVFGKVTVTLTNTEVFSDFVIRTLAIRQNCQAPDKQKIVRQFHYTAWPDKGVPKFSSSLLDFQNKVRNTKTYDQGPLLVHCSAGIGRTGTYIALDILTEQGKLLGYVDVFACVAALRGQRVNMVQTLDQYVFLHRALTEALVFSSSAIPAYAFQKAYIELLQIHPKKRRRQIEITFDMLRQMSPIVDEEEYVPAKDVRNKSKNRYSNILPVSAFMPTTKGSSSEGYVNAVYLPSYKYTKAMILTQMPLANTKEDFWALVQEHNVHTIVMMNTVSEVAKEEIYWPKLGKCQKFNGFEVECTGVETVGHHAVVTMSFSSNDTKRTVTQIQCLYWPAKQSLPNSPLDIIKTLELVRQLQQHSGNHPLIAHCMNGVDRSGLFCVINAVMERLKIEQDVAIIQVIEEMRCCRFQIIPSVDQFQFCHEVVQAYIQQFCEYSNFSDL